MRPELFYNPRVLLERLAIASSRRRRLAKLDGSVAAGLELGHIDSLELLELRRSKPPKVVYDIGANIGTWSLLARAVFPEAEIHAFEPWSAHRTKYLERTSGLGKTELHAVALGTQTGEGTLHVTSRSDSSSLLRPAVDESDPGMTLIGHERVQVERLDEYVAHRRLPLPDLIKLDVQGYELEVLRAGEGCLEHADAVLTEVSFVELYAGQCLFHEIVRFLAERAFHVTAFGQGTVLGQELAQADVLFVKR